MPVRNSRRQRLPLPTVINPAGRLCVTLEIPDHPDHIRDFWGFLWGITRWFAWELDDETTKAKQVADVWLEVYQIAHQKFADGVCGEPCEECPEYPPPTIDPPDLRIKDGCVEWFNPNTETWECRLQLPSGSAAAADCECDDWYDCDCDESEEW